MRFLLCFFKLLATQAVTWTGFEIDPPWRWINFGMCSAPKQPKFCLGQKASHSTWKCMEKGSCQKRAFVPSESSPGMKKSDSDRHPPSVQSIPLILQLCELRVFGKTYWRLEEDGLDDTRVVDSNKGKRISTRISSLFIVKCKSRLSEFSPVFELTRWVSHGYNRLSNRRASREQNWRRAHRESREHITPKWLRFESGSLLVRRTVPNGSHAIVAHSKRLSAKGHNIVWSEGTHGNPSCFFQLATQWNIFHCFMPPWASLRASMTQFLERLNIQVGPLQGNLCSSVLRVPITHLVFNSICLEVCRRIGKCIDSRYSLACLIRPIDDADDSHCNSRKLFFARRGQPINAISGLVCITHQFLRWIMHRGRYFQPNDVHQRTCPHPGEAIRGKIRGFGFPVPFWTFSSNQIPKGHIAYILCKVLCPWYRPCTPSGAAMFLRTPSCTRSSSLKTFQNAKTREMSLNKISKSGVFCQRQISHEQTKDFCEQISFETVHTNFHGNRKMLVLDASLTRLRTCFLDPRFVLIFDHISTQMTCRNFTVKQTHLFIVAPVYFPPKTFSQEIKSW